LFFQSKTLQLKTLSRSVGPWSFDVKRLDIKMM